MDLRVLVDRARDCYLTRARVVDLLYLARSIITQSSLFAACSLVPDSLRDQTTTCCICIVIPLCICISIPLCICTPIPCIHIRHPAFLRLAFSLTLVSVHDFLLFNGPPSHASRSSTRRPRFPNPNSTAYSRASRILHQYHARHVGKRLQPHGQAGRDHCKAE